MIRKEDMVQIGYFLKPHGVKGELMLVTDNNILKNAECPYVICEIEGILVPFFIESFRHKNATSILIKIMHIDDQSNACKFIGKAVYLPASILLQSADSDKIFVQSIIGYVVSDPNKGDMGIIREIDKTTSNTLMSVDYNGKELLIPVADELICRLDHKEKKLTLSLPDGLLDL